MIKKEQFIGVSKKTLDMINRYLTVEPKDASECLGEDETIRFTADFGNGIEMDIKVCGVQFDEFNTSNTAWTEAVLFDNGCQVACSDVDDTFEGEWRLEYDGIEYVANVVEEETMRTFTAYMPEKNMPHIIGQKIYILRRDGLATILNRDKIVGYVSLENTGSPLCKNSEYLNETDYSNLPRTTVATVVGYDFTEPDENGKKYRILMIVFDYMKKAILKPVFEVKARNIRYIPKQLRTVDGEEMVLRYTNKQNIAVEFQGEVIGWLKPSQKDNHAYENLRTHLMNDDYLTAWMTNSSTCLDGKDFTISMLFIA